MTTRKEVSEFVHTILTAVRADNRPATPISLDDDLRIRLGLTDPIIAGLASLLNDRFFIHIQADALIVAKTVDDVTSMVFAETQRSNITVAGSRRSRAYTGSKAKRTADFSKVDAEMTVWYGTNRKRIDGDDGTQTFSAQRGNVTSLGRCRVFVPRGHKMGSTGSNWIKRLMGGDDRLRLLETKVRDQMTYWSDLQTHFALIPDDHRTAVVFIHGYNVSFEQAAIRTAQIGFDLAVKGAMAFFSWPSQGKLAGYLPDSQNLEASEDAIITFLEEFAKRSGANTVHLIAHSMGNRGLLRAVDRIVTRAGRSGGALFSQIILAAPDVDSDTFRSLCNAYHTIGKRTTLYVSQKDLAVEASSWIHESPRAGFSPPVFVAPGIDTVSVTNVDISQLGHGYVAEAREVLMDIHRLLFDGADPANRNLVGCSNDAGSTYWEFRR